jgi:hypothetical protein
LRPTIGSVLSIFTDRRVTMPSPSWKVLSIATLVLLTASCAKLPSPSTGTGPTIAIEEPAASDRIPAAYGNLVAVTDLQASNSGVVLWFQDKDGNVRAVTYAPNLQRIMPKVRLFARS